MPETLRSVLTKQIEIMKTYILLMPIKSFEREEAERIENNVYESIEFLYGLYYGKEIFIIELTDFMDLMNDQDDVTDSDKYWMTYVQVKNNK